MDILNQILNDFCNNFSKEFYNSIKNNFSLSSLIDKMEEISNKMIIKYIENALEKLDYDFQKFRENKKELLISHSKQTKTILTKIGDIKIKRNRYKNRKNNYSFFFIDEILSIDKRERIDKEMQIKIIKNAVDYNYYKAAELTGNQITSQTCFNIVKRYQNTFKLPIKQNNLNDLNKIYIEADEDHVALQNGKNKQLKLLYIHEGYQLKEDGKKHLINPRYYIGLKHNELWGKAKRYISKNYKENIIVSISGDGANWIKSGLKYFEKVEFHLDKFHTMQSVIRLSAGSKERKRELINSIINQDIEYLKERQNKYKNKQKLNSISYLISNLDNICLNDKTIKCSAEGHVSHILSSRFSSRPMAWSVKGLERMGKLRAYKFNGGTYNEIHKKKNLNNTYFNCKAEEIIEKTKNTKWEPIKFIIPSLNSSNKILRDKLNQILKFN